MKKIRVAWKAYPMDRSGIKHPIAGTVEVTPWVQYQKVVEEAKMRAYQDHPELRSTPLFISR